MIKNIKLEFFKIRHRKVYTSVLGVMAVTFLWALFSQSYKSKGDSLQEWMSLFYDISTINCVIMPILTAIIASKIVDIEHKGNTFKLLKTLQGSRNLFTSKFICGIIIVLFSMFLQAVSMILISLINGYRGIPLSHFIYFLFYTTLISVILLLIQMTLSFQFVNQMVAFVVAITGSFLGLFSLFFGGIISKLILWGYYGSLSPVGMEWDNVSRLTNYYWNPIPVFDLGILIILLIALYILGKRLFILKEE